MDSNMRDWAAARSPGNGHLAGGVPRKRPPRPPVAPYAGNGHRGWMAVAGGDRDIDLYHWSTPRFSSVWQDTLSVLVARGRARVSVSASAADWPKRIRDMQYVDHDDFAVAH